MYQLDERQQNVIVLPLIGLLLGVAILPFILKKPINIDKYSMIDNKRVQPKCLKENEILFTKEELAQHKNLPSILLGFMGVVYNVSNGHYYHPDGSYSFFAGRDGTRSFLTGEFNIENNEIRDDISDLDNSYLNGIETWINLYNDKYKRIGLVIGSYYDKNGCETNKLKKIKKKLKNLNNNKIDEQNELNKYPPCNSQFDMQSNNGKVWCSKLSGGIQRSWTGLPRLFYDLYQKKWRCACVNENEINNVNYCDQENQSSKESIGIQYYDDDDDDDDIQNSNQNFDNNKLTAPSCRFKHYPNCDPKSFECSIFD